MTKNGKLPSGLSPEMKRWWRQIVSAWELDTSSLRLLEVAAVAWDTATRASAAVEAEGQFFKDRQGIIRPHPGLQVALANRRLFLQSLRDLGLEEVKPPAGGKVHYGPY